MNEELQSVNEELKTFKEELQSLNEELSSVNQQLQSKVDQLEDVNNDPGNLLRSTDVATLFLDRELCIQRFRPATRRLFKVLPGDVGRPLADLAQKFTDADLADDAEEFLDEGHVALGHLQADGGQRDGMDSLQSDRRVAATLRDRGQSSKASARRCAPRSACRRSSSTATTPGATPGRTARVCG
jgi:hypothetical protein